MDKPRILIVDDKEENLYLLRLLLQGHGYVVDEARHGVAALELARRDPPALVIADILMPVMDGFALCREWRLDERLRGIPFIFYTATYTDERDREFGLGLGADRFVVKPAEPDELLAIVRELLRPVPVGAQALPAAAAPEEATYLKQYNETLIRKLEAQAEELERVNRELMQDIARRRQTEAALADTDANLRVLLNALPESQLLLDRDGRIIAANETACRRLGCAMDALIGRDAYELLPEGVREERRRWVEALLESKQPQRFEDQRNGMWVDNHIYPILDARGEVVRMAIVGFDITERRQSEQRVLQLNRLLAALSDINQLIVYRSERGRLLRETCRILVERSGLKMAWIGFMDLASGQVRSVASAGFDAGYTEKINVRWDDTPEGQGPTGTAIRTGGPFVCADILHNPRLVPWQSKAGERGYRSSASFPIRIRGEIVGALTAYSGVVNAFGEDSIALFEELATNIGYALQSLEEQADREQAEVALKNSEERFRTLVEMAPDAIFIVTGGNFAYINQAGVRLFGASRREELVGQPVIERYHPDCRARIREGMVQVDKMRQAVSMVQDSCLTMDGKRFEVELSACPFVYEGQDGALVFVRDITERQQAEAELRRHREHLAELVEERTSELAEARDQAQAANRAKSIFLANMSHELRTPLTAVLGFTDILSRDAALPADARNNLSIIIRSGEHLLALINDILDLSKIEAGRSVPECSDFNFDGLVHDLLSMMHVRAQGKSLRLVLEQSPSCPHLVNTDAGKLRQILVNLLGNAIKFTPAGQVTLHLDAEPQEGGYLLRVEVRDTGIGITPENLDRIFLPFEQAVGRVSEGTGLGLAITLQYVQMLGGKISVTSEVGKGSCFHFTLPVGQVGEAPVAPRDPRRVLGFSRQAENFRILVVEDQPDNRLIFECLLKPMNFQLREAVNGQEAIAIFEEWHPHLVFMDRRMPVLDGLETTRRIRSLPGGRDTVIIAVSAHSFVEEQREMRDAGCDDFLCKPFVADELFSLVQKFLHLDAVYAEENPVKSRTSALSASDFKFLSPEELALLYRLAGEGDDEALSRWLETQKGLSPATCDALAALIKSFRADVIRDLVEPLVV